MTSLGSADVVIIGAGIVGLAHAAEAVARGLSVIVVERDEWAAGASVRNFGHGCFTAQSGIALQYAMAARETWLRLAKQAGFWVSDSGTVVVARADDELSVLREFAAERDEVVLLDAEQVGERIPAGPGTVGGAWLPLDIRVDPRACVSAIASWLSEQGVRFHWSTTAHTIDPGEVRTSRGVVRTSRIVLAAGHDADRHFPVLAKEVQRCALRMLRVHNPYTRCIQPAVLSGFSLLRYDGFHTCPSFPAVRDRLGTEHPELIDIGLNLMLTQRPDGTLTIGDTHTYSKTLDPFVDNELDEHIMRETARLLGAPGLTVVERWQGVYASAPDPFLIATPADGIRVVAVTSGIGMTTAFGLAPAVLDTF